jgi:hypothetical protein
MGRNDYTGLLYSQPSLMEGFARSLDIGGTFDEYNDSASESEADMIAMGSDWYAIGADLHHAISGLAVRLKNQVSHGGRPIPS